MKYNLSSVHILIRIVLILPVCFFCLFFFYLKVAVAIDLNQQDPQCQVKICFNVLLNRSVKSQMAWEWVKQQFFNTFLILVHWKLLALARKGINLCSFTLVYFSVHTVYVSIRNLFSWLWHVCHNHISTGLINSRSVTTQRFGWIWCAECDWMFVYQAFVFTLDVHVW